MKVLIVANYIKDTGGISIVVQNHFNKINAEGDSAEIFSTKKSTAARLFLLLPLLLKVRKFDIIHLHGCSFFGFFPIVLGIAAGKIFFNKKTIVTYHGGGARQFLKRRNKFVKSVLKRADHITVMSGFLQRTFLEYGIKTVILPNLLEIESRNNYSADYRKPRLVSTRYLDEGYNVLDIIKAFQLIQARHSEAELKIIGAGPESAKLKEYCETKDLTNIKFLGKLPNHLITGELSESNIFISVPSDDNQPMSVLEAFASGTIVISSRVGGIPDMIEDNVTGLLVDVNSPEQIKEKVEWIINNPSGAEAITKNANKALERFRWSSIRTQLYNLYEN